MVRSMLAALGVACALAGGSLAAAEQPAEKPPPQAPEKSLPEKPQPAKARAVDPVGDNLFAPELILRYADPIGLTNEQRQSVRALIEKTQDRLADLNAPLAEAQQALAEVLKGERPDADEALARFGRLLAAEDEIRRVHVAFLIGLKNVLGADQQARLQEIRTKPPARGKAQAPVEKVPQSIQLKRLSVQHQSQSLKAEGCDLRPVQEVMKRFEPLLRERKYEEAETVLDEALKVLAEIAGP